jgi:hypothetical protein
MKIKNKKYILFIKKINIIKNKMNPQYFNDDLK